MSERTRIESLARRDRWLVGGALGVAVALSWAWLVPMAVQVKRDGMMCGVASWVTCDTGDLAMLCAMWVVMMAGMMLPSAAPTMLLYGCVVRKSPDGEKATEQIYAFAGGYLLVWSAFSFIATLLQYAFAQALLLSPTMKSQNRIFGGLLLIAAGAYQFTPLKRACLNACRSPAEFLTRHWRPGVGGGFHLGVANGLYCLGCCWALMLLLFVGGVMNLWWIAALTIFVLLEKVAPFGVVGGRISGIALGAAGIWHLVRHYL